MKSFSEIRRENAFKRDHQEYWFRLVDQQWFNFSSCVSILASYLSVRAALWMVKSTARNVYDGIIESVGPEPKLEDYAHIEPQPEPETWDDKI